MNDRAWSSLKNGDQLNAEHIQQLGDYATEVTGQLAVGLAAGGCFICPTDTVDVPSNRVVADGAGVRVDNLCVLTRSGLRAAIPTPEKTFSRPKSGERFLNLYAPEFIASQRDTRAMWENEPASGPFGITLAVWSDEHGGFAIQPMPFVPGAQTQVLSLVREIAESGRSLIEALVASPVQGLRSLQLQESQRSELSTLMLSLERVGRARAMSPMGAVLLELETVADELLNWFHYLAARAEAGGPSRNLTDALGRRQSRAQQRREVLPLPVAALTSPPRTGSELLLWLDALKGALEELTEVVTGAAEDIPLEPFERFSGPYGATFLYDISNQSQPVLCVISMEGGAQPTVVCGYGPKPELPHLSMATLVKVESGYRATVGPLAPVEGHQLAIAVNPPVPMRVHARLGSDAAVGERR